MPTTQDLLDSFGRDFSRYLALKGYSSKAIHMPPIETDLMFQRAVLWPASGYDDYGQPKVGAPIEVDVRWKWVRKEAADAEGNPITTDATVVVDRLIPVGSTMWLGCRANYREGRDVVMRVATYHETPDLKNREVRRTVDLAFYKTSTPERA